MHAISQLEEKKIRVQLSLNEEELNRLSLLLPHCILHQQVIEDDAAASSGMSLVSNNFRAMKNRFLLRKGKELVSVHCNEIAYFYSKNKLSYLKTFNGRCFLVRMSLEEIEECISPEQFFRASRQVITCHEAVQKVLLWFNGNLKVELSPKEIDHVIVSRLKANHFMEWLGE